MKKLIMQLSDKFLKRLMFCTLIINIMSIIISVLSLLK